MEIEWKDISNPPPLDKPLWIFRYNRTHPVCLAVKQGEGGLVWLELGLLEPNSEIIDETSIKAWAEFYYPPAPQVRWEA